MEDSNWKTQNCERIIFKQILKICRGKKWIELVQDMVHWQDLVKTVIKHQV